MLKQGRSKNPAGEISVRKAPAPDISAGSAIFSRCHDMNVFLWRRRFSLDILIPAGYFIKKRLTAEDIRSPQGILEGIRGHIGLAKALREGGMRPEEAFVKSLDKKQKDALQEIKNSAPREWEEFEKARREAIASPERKTEFMATMLMLTRRIIQKAPPEAILIHSFKRPRPPSFSDGQRVIDGIFNLTSPLQKKAILETKKAAPREWALFESSILEALDGGGLPAWIRLIVTRTLVEKAAPKESENLIMANEKTSEDEEREMKKEGGWKLFQPRSRPN